MSEHDKQFDEYLDGQSAVSRAYEQLGDDGPSELTEARILAAARDAIAHTDDNTVVQLSRWRRWGVSAALAATVVLAMPLVYHVFGPKFQAPSPAPAEADFVRVAPPESEGRIEIELLDDDPSAPVERVAQPRVAVSAAEQEPAPVELANAADVDTGVDLQPEPPQAQPASSPPRVAAFSDTPTAPAALGAAPAAGTEAREEQPAPMLRRDADQAEYKMAQQSTPDAETRETLARSRRAAAEADNSAADRVAMASDIASEDSGLQEVVVAGSRAGDSYLDADNWAARIWKQHRAGRERSARRELGELLQMYPDYELPDGFPLDARQAITPSRNIIPDAEDWLRGIAITYDRGNVDEARQQLARFFERYRDYELPNWFPMDRSDAAPIER